MLGNKTQNKTNVIVNVKIFWCFQNQNNNNKKNLLQKERECKNDGLVYVYVFLNETRKCFVYNWWPLCGYVMVMAWHDMEFYIYSMLTTIWNTNIHYLCLKFHFFYQEYSIIFTIRYFVFLIHTHLPTNQSTLLI